METSNNTRIRLNKRQLKTATRILRRVLEEKHILKNRVEKVLQTAKYVLKTRTGRCQTHLLAFWGARGYGLVLLTGKNGKIQFGISCRLNWKEEKSQGWRFAGKIWLGTNQLPKLTQEALLELQTPAGVIKRLRSGLRK